MGWFSSSSEQQQHGQHQQPNQAPPRTYNRQSTIKFKKINDNFTNIAEVSDALRRNGLESSELIIGIDYTKSNEWMGEKTFGKQCLHAINPMYMNPYQEAINIVGRTLEAFDDDNYIPVYGFGDSRTHANQVFGLNANDIPCHGLPQVLQRYMQVTPNVKMSGPTSFGPIIRQAMHLVQHTNNRFHILVIIADGQVTRSVDTPPGTLSPFEADTVNAIVEASQLPLAIIMIGVGDGPWDAMREFDDQLPSRVFDNFQFVDFTDVMRKYGANPQTRDAQFALRALMEIPEQYSIIQRMGLLQPGKRLPHLRVTKPLDPPPPQMPPPLTQSATFQGQPTPQNTLPHSQSMFQGQPANTTPFAPVAATAPGPQPPGAGGSKGKSSLSATKSSPDDIFICPITQDVMRDPVIATDGFTYDRKAIQEWLAAHQTSPMTGDKMPNDTLIPNNALKSRILDAYPNLK